MIISRYTILFECDNENYAYNTFSNALIKINDQLDYDNLLTAQNNKACICRADYDDDFYSVLEEHNIITDNDEDDFLYFKSIIMNMRKSQTSMHLTLAPTMDCCFRCHYCFEKYKAKTYMSPEVMDSIIKHVTSIDTLKSLYLTWFGGEPLMAIRQIEQFYDKFNQIWGEKLFFSNIITTGYHLDEKVIGVLNKVRVSSVQITLDGNRETHNKVKHFPGSGDVFERVLRNIELYNDISPDVNIVIRVNLTLDNAHEYESLYATLVNRFQNRKMVSIAPAFVIDRASVGCKSTATLFNKKQCSDFILKLSQKDIDSIFVRYPDSSFNECAIRNNIAIAFDPEGYAYKCWEVIGNKKYSVGIIDSNGTIANVNVKMLNRQLYGADPLEDPKCRECKYLPICIGGCPIHRIENKFENGKNDCCFFHKGSMEEFLKEHIRRRKMGLSNR